MLIDCHTHIYPDDAAELKAVNRIFGAYAGRILTDNPVRLLAL